MSFDPIANIMERDGVDEREAIRRYAIEAADPEQKVCEVQDCPGFGVAHPPLPVDHQSIADNVQRLYGLAREVALNEVERLARLVLLHDDKLHEFVMGNGAAFYTISVPGEPVALDEHPAIAAQMLERFFIDWDDALKLSGHPMRFTATGEKVTDW